MRRNLLGVSLAIGLSAACSGTDDSGTGDWSNGGVGGSGSAIGAGSVPVGGGSTPSVGPGGGPPVGCNDDGVLDPGEACDGPSLGGRTCSTETMGVLPAGTLSCSGCQVVTTGCTGGPGSGGAPGTGGAGSTSGAPGLGGSGNVPSNTGGMTQGAGGAPAAQGETGRMVGMTAAHNAIRQTVSPGNPLPPLTWSPSVAAVAQAYADELASRGCEMVHSGAAGLGENLARFWGQAGSAQTTVNLWASELSCYTYGAFMRGDSCTSACDESGGCGHYTQIVWRNTTEVGCGVASCGSSEIWVCNYSPPGNYVGQNPY